ncbi:hypothetical protein LX99_00419 [Mucilaginibacter oryzae]|uniref:Uncharacterized protein n=1 Tax=Mucilaginibacter oryzae TaxID=468058 RepID=A0A316HH57_9SPHI|nr:hypothetical protein [Mucilaginibacter oryzae]PWK79958.1 hypothetical protein LX99_00419 [Mucilaginibacter oryzae]
MELKKIVISPDNKKAIAFFDELDRKKAEMFKKIDEMAAKKFPALKKK